MDYTNQIDPEYSGKYCNETKSNVVDQLCKITRDLQLDTFQDSSADKSSSDEYDEELMDDLVKKSRPQKGSRECQQPYCHITLKCTKESTIIVLQVAGANSISEVLRRLDFLNAVKDIRRFNYICKLLHLLITQNLTSLSGCGSKVLFSMLERVASQVASNQQNVHILQLLLSDLDQTIRKYYCWGRPLGSTLLWERHFRTLERICRVASGISFTPRPDPGPPRLTDLPAELMREILLRLTDPRDLRAAGQACRTMDNLLHERHVWRQLVRFHFTQTQIATARAQYLRPGGAVDWEGLFHHLRKKHGLREEYADYLFLCRHCRCLFWK
ncbi:FBXO32, partial [Cordylochernes scorpioides]